MLNIYMIDFVFTAHCFLKFHVFFVPNSEAAANQNLKAKNITCSFHTQLTTVLVPKEQKW